MTPSPNSGADADWQSVFIEAVAEALSRTGLPKSTARVLAWLHVCEPERQTAAELQSGLKLSAGTVSMALSFLGRIGVIEKSSEPGSKRPRYRLRDDPWKALLSGHLRLLTKLGTAAETSLSHQPGNRRLRDMKKLRSWMVRSLEVLQGGE